MAAVFCLHFEVKIYKKQFTIFSEWVRIVTII